MLINSEDGHKFHGLLKGKRMSDTAFMDGPNFLGGELGIKMTFFFVICYII